MADVLDQDEFQAIQGNDPDTASDYKDVTVTEDGSRVRLDVQSKSDDQGSAAAPGCPVYSAKYRSVIDVSDLTLTASYQTVYNYSGSGKFSSFVVNFNTSDADLKVTIDGTDTIFEFHMADISSLNNGIFSSGEEVWSDANKQLHFNPRCAIEYASSFKIEAKSDGTLKKVTGYLVSLTKET